MITPCQRGCCWSPYGHSTLRDGPLAIGVKRCACHDNEPREDAA